MLLDYEQSVSMVQKYGIPIPSGKIVQTEKEAIKTAEEFGYPVVLKLISPKVVHKTDIGGIKLGLHSKESLLKAFKSLSSLGRKYKPYQILIQKQVSGVQLILGGKTEEQFGKVVLVGIGGIYTEVYKDVSFRIVPVRTEDIIEMLKELKGFMILQGYRGEKVDISKIVKAVLAVQDILRQERVQELDINPLVASEGKLWAVDIRIVK